MTTSNRRRSAPEPEPAVEVSDIPDYTTIRDLPRDFDTLVAKLDEALEAQKAWKETEREVRGELVIALARAHVKTVGWHGRRVTAKDGRSPNRIDRDLLIKKAKLSLDMIEKCTIPGTAYTTVVISKAKEIETE